MKTIDLTGRRFGRLIAVKRCQRIIRPNGSSRYRWECVCDCGQTKKIETWHLMAGHSNSCGCQTYKWMERGRAAKNLLFAKYKAGAKKRGIVFELAFDGFITLCQSACDYCGASPSQSVKRRASYEHFHGDFIHNGIDRVDNNQGYVVGNCVACCSICNVMKNTLTKSQFLEHVKRIHEHRHR